MLICECLVKVNYFAKLKVDVIQAFGNMALAVFVPYHHILRAARLRSREENGPRTRIILQVQIRQAGLVRHTEYSKNNRDTLEYFRRSKCCREDSLLFISTHLRYTNAKNPYQVDPVTSL